MVKFMTVLTAAFKEFHLYKVPFHVIPLSIYTISYYRSPAIPHGHWDVSTTMRLARNPDPNQARRSPLSRADDKFVSSNFWAASSRGLRQDAPGDPSSC